MNCSTCNALRKRIHKFDKVVRDICTVLNICYAGVDVDKGEIVNEIRKLKEKHHV